MDFYETIQFRYSCRLYKSDAIEKEKLDAVLNAARLAPTAANRQPFQLIVIDSQEHKSELLRIYNRDWFVQAPIVICGCAVLSEAWTRRDGKNYAEVDTTIALDHLILTATALGFGTCWVAAFDPVAARKFLKLPSDWEPVAFTPLGYPADNWSRKSRKPISKLVKRI